MGSHQMLAVDRPTTAAQVVTSFQKGPHGLPRYGLTAGAC